MSRKNLIFTIFFGVIFVVSVFYGINKSGRQYQSYYLDNQYINNENIGSYDEESVYSVDNTYYKQDNSDKKQADNLNYKSVNWNLSSLFASDEAWTEELNKFSENIYELNNYIGKITRSKTHLLSALKIKEELDIRLEKLYAYAKLNRDTNKNSYKYLNMLDDIMRVDYKYNKIISDLELEILNLSDSTYQQYLKNKKISKKYKTYLEEIRRSKEHYLDSGSEDILSKLGNVASLPANIYDLFVNMDKKYNNTSIDYASDIKSEDRQKRKEAYTNEFIPYNDNINTLAGLLIGQANKNVFYSDIRKYNSALEMNLDSDYVDITVYDNLLKTVGENTSSLHKYVSLRKKLLKVDKVHFYDMRVPIVKEDNSDIPYNNAVALTYAALSPLGDEYEDIVYKAFNEKWIDVYSDNNKVSGGYCMSIYDNHPYVLMNYDNSLNSVSTLVHELGHGVYSYLSQKNQTYYNSNPSVLTQEVASTTNEALLYEFLIKNAGDKEQKVYYISQYLDFIKDTLFIQTMYSEFEKEIHCLIENNENINTLVLNDLWSKLLKKYYGNDFEVDSLAMIGWSRIPHFYNSFYVYKYATGCSSAISFSQDIIKNGPDKYIKFLKQGNCDKPLNLLKKSGVDLNNEKAIKISIDKFNELLSELEQLTDN